MLNLWFSLSIFGRSRLYLALSSKRCITDYCSPATDHQVLSTSLIALVKFIFHVSHHSRLPHNLAVTWLDCNYVVSFNTTQKFECSVWRHCRNRITWLSRYEGVHCNRLQCQRGKREWPRKLSVRFIAVMRESWNRKLTFSFMASSPAG